MNGLVRGYTRHLVPVSPSAARTDPLDRGLVGEWRFDPCTGAVLPDYSGYGNHGDIRSGTPWVIRDLGHALQFDDNVAHFVQVPMTSPIDLLYPMTIEFFGYIRSDSFGGYFIAMRDGAQSQWAVRRVNDTVAFYAYNGDEGDSTSIFPAWDALYHVVITLDAIGTTVTFYADGIEATNDGAIAAPTQAASDLFIGVRGNGAGGGAYSVDTDMLLVRLYDRVLTAGEVQERHQLCLKRAQPMAHAWMMPWGAVLAGTAYFQAAAGAFTPAGVLVRQGQKVLVGALTPAGALTNEAQKILAGAVTSAGALVREPQKVLAGTLTSAGALTRETSKPLSGAVTPTGTTVKGTQKVMAGAITPAGTLTEMIGLSLSGALTLAGTLVRRTSKVLVGAITPTATLTSPSIPIIARASRLLRIAMTGAPLRGDN